MPICIVPEISDLTMFLTPEEQALLLGGTDLQNIQLSERIHICGPCSSTLDVAHFLAQKGQFDPWDSVLTIRQWAGRGQLRRTWISEPGNVFATWRLPLPPVQWQGLLPVLLGWIVCSALAELGISLRLKWPNDLLAHDRKVGGILIEERGDVLLAGIGLNLVSCPQDQQMRADRACVAGTLIRDLAGLSSLELWLRLVHLGRLGYNTLLLATTPLEFVQSLRSRLAYLGENVLIRDNQSCVRGIFTGIDAHGRLELLVDGQPQIFFSGSLTCDQ